VNSAHAGLPRLWLIALVTSAAPVHAQASGSGSLEAQLRQCSTVSEPGARLACYDGLTRTAPSAAATAPGAASIAGPAAGSASSSVNATSATPTPSVAAAPPAAAAPSSSAVASAPAVPAGAANAEFGVRNSALEAKRAPAREKHMLAVISSVSMRGHGELVLTLDNGQVWTQIEARDYPARPGDHIEIDEGALGSYVLWSPANRRATKVTRIR
jgi:hypothetical protein